MAEVTVTLTQSEYEDRQCLSQDRLQEPENTTHDLVVEAIAGAIGQRRLRANARTIDNPSASSKVEDLGIDGYVTD